jgi:hypothetical protein
VVGKFRSDQCPVPLLACDGLPEQALAVAFPLVHLPLSQYPPAHILKLAFVHSSPAFRWTAHFDEDVSQ